MTVEDPLLDRFVEFDELAICDEESIRRPPVRSRNITESFGHAIAGLRYTLATQRNARVHLAAAVAAFLVSVALGLSPVELAIVGLAVAVVVFAELLNTVVEAVVDLSCVEIHPLARVAKDVAAGAVLWSAICSVIIGVLILGPYVLRLFG